MCPGADQGLGFLTNEAIQQAIDLQQVPCAQMVIILRILSGFYSLTATGTIEQPNYQVSEGGTDSQTLFLEQASSMTSFDHILILFPLNLYFIFSFFSFLCYLIRADGMLLAINRKPTPKIHSPDNRQ